MNLPSLEHLHHAIIITGNRQENLEGVKKYLISEGIAVQGNPDLIIFDDEQILMETADMIVRSVESKKVGEHRFCIISTDRMAADVQNIFLKTLEEPEFGTHFVILIPTKDRLPPTVLSRCQVIEGNQSIREVRLSATEFLSNSLSERFALIEEWTKAKKDEDNLSKTEVLQFLEQVEKELWNRANRDEVLFADIRKLHEYAGIRGASHRIILDFLAMIAPVVK